MKRGDIVTISLPGDYGKPRPALVIQSDLFAEHPSVTVLPVTSELRVAPITRISVKPSAQNGLRKPSQVMVDKTATLPRDKVKTRIGTLEPETLRSVNQALVVFMGLT